MSDGLTKTYETFSRHGIIYALAVPILLVIWILQGRPIIESYDADWCLKNCSYMKEAFYSNNKLLP